MYKNIIYRTYNMKKIKIIMAALSTRKSIRKLLKNPADKTN